jgi:FixJ family two-component response regulator
MPASASSAECPTVHVVDDDDAVRRSLAFLLESASFCVRLHGSAAEVLTMLDQLATGCLLVDCDMPGIGGLELLRRLRLHRVALPCILVTGKHAAGLREAAQAAGAAAVIEKPFDSEELILAIRNVLSGS